MLHINIPCCRLTVVPVMGYPDAYRFQRRTNNIIVSKCEIRRKTDQSIDRSTHVWMNEWMRKCVYYAIEIWKGAYILWRYFVKDLTRFSPVRALTNPPARLFSTIYVSCCFSVIILFCSMSILFVQRYTKLLFRLCILLYLLNLKWHLVYSDDLVYLKC